MPLAMEVDLSPRDFVLNGDPAPHFPKRRRGPGRSPRFSAHVYYGQTDGWIKMALGMEVGFGPVHIVVDGVTAPSQTAGCIEMSLGMELGLSPGDFALDADPARTPKGAVPHPLFGTCLLWPNGCMDQDATWYGGRPRPTRHCVRCGPRYSQKKGHTHSHPIFGPYLLWPNGWMDEDAAWYESRSRPRPHCTRLGPNSRERGTSAPSFRPMSIVATVAHLSYC